MPLLTQSPAQFVTSVENAIIGAVSRVKSLNFTPGSVLGGLVNAFVSQLAFVQNQMIYQVQVTRAATSQGADLTSFVSDYFLNPPRLPAIAAFGPVTFGKYQTSSAPISIAVGTIIQTVAQPPLTSTQYQVIADLTNSNYNAGTNSYVLPAGQTSIAVTCQALVAGTAGNVAAGALTVIVTPGVSIDYVTNPAAIQNGVNQETDAALRIRFMNYISGLSQATLSAISAAVQAVGVNLTFTVNDQLNASYVAAPGYFTVVVDDGSGAIPAATITSVLAAVNAARAAGITGLVIAPTNVTITIAVNGTVIAPGFQAAAVRAALQQALINYVNANGVGGGGTNKLSYIGVGNLIGSFIGTLSSQGLQSYSSFTVNGGTVDVPLTNYQLARASTGTVTVS